MGAYITNIYSSLLFLSKAILIDAEFIRDTDDIERTFWRDIAETRSDKQLVNILNDAYGTDIENLTFSQYFFSGERGDRYDRYKLFMALPDRALHIDDYGEGLRYAFSILVVASRLNDTVQLFIMTHSLDLVKQLAQFSDRYDIRVYLRIDADGSLLSRVIPSVDLA